MISVLGLPSGAGFWWPNFLASLMSPSLASAPELEKNILPGILT